MNKNALTIKEATQMTGVSRQTLYYWMDKGLPYSQVGHFRLISVEDLRDYQNKKTRGGNKNV